ncbi:TetR/AcrR family transcriptional regulator [Nocardia sp. NPDC003482]
MVRLTRAEQQIRTRRKVLEAAKAEFTARGFRGATVDGIAERADLTRGAVYSNFPGKRALYLSVLAHEAEHAPPPAGRKPARTLPAALESFAGTWMQRIPRSTSYDSGGSSQLQSPNLSIDFIPEITSDERLRRPFTQLLAFDAILLGRAMQSLEGRSEPSTLPSYVATAESILTILYGATQLSFAAPEFVNAAHVMALCGKVATLDEPPEVDPAPRPGGRGARAVVEAWIAPECVDLLHNRPARFGARQLIAVLGIDRLATIADALVALPAQFPVTVVIGTADPAETAPLARLAVADVSRSLRHAFPAAALANLQVVVDDSGVAVACGVPAVDDGSEAALLVARDHVVTRAEGRAAAAAVAARANSVS